jgi:hypothetical protein
MRALTKPAEMQSGSPKTCVDSFLWFLIPPWTSRGFWLNNDGHCNESQLESKGYFWAEHSKACAIDENLDATVCFKIVPMWPHFSPLLTIYFRAGKAFLESWSKTICYNSRKFVESFSRKNIALLPIWWLSSQRNLAHNTRRMFWRI